MLSSKNLSWNIRKQALGYFVFLKRKQSGKMKAIGCSNGHPQQKYITTEESSSSTVSLYALIGVVFNRCNGQNKSNNRKHAWYISTMQLAIR